MHVHVGSRFCVGDYVCHGWMGAYVHKEGVAEMCALFRGRDDCIHAMERGGGDCVHHGAGVELIICIQCGEEDVIVCASWGRRGDCVRHLGLESLCVQWKRCRDDCVRHAFVRAGDRRSLVELFLAR